MTTPTEELSPPPYSVYPSVPLAQALYPETAKWGLGQRETDPNALFTFENWYAATVNDLYAIYWRDSSIAVASAVVTKVSDRYNLSIPKTKIPEGEFPVYGQVTRAASGQLVRSMPDTYLVKTKRPGGLTFWASEQFHRGLILSVEGFAAGAILNPTNITSGLWCLITRYENIRKNDTVTVAYGATTIDHVVSPDEAAGPGPIRVFISPSVIQAGNLYGPVSVQFMVRDVVNNTSGEKYAYSRPYLLNSELDPSLLDPPIFTVNEVEASVVDLDQFSAARFAALVALPRKTPTPSPSNRVVLILVITQVTEYGESTRTLRLPAVTDRNLRGESIPIGNDVLSSLTDATVSLRFEWQTGTGSPLGHSGTSVVRVVGTPTPDVLPYPTLNGASTTAQVTTVDPLAIQYNTGVTVKYPGMLATDSITLSWIYQDGSQYQTTLSGHASGAVVFDLTAAQVLHHSVNSRVQLKYSIQRGGRTAQSTVQTVTVGAIAPSLLPTPTINYQANGTVIDLNNFAGNAQLTLSQWPLSKAGQRVWITLMGEGRSQEVLTDYVVKTNDAINGLVNQAVLRNVLTALPRNSRFQIETRVAYDGGTDKWRAVVFPTASYIINDSWTDAVSNFPGGSYGPWSAGAGAAGGYMSGTGFQVVTALWPASNAGVLFNAVRNFNSAHRYRVDATIYNQSGYNDPLLAIYVAGQTLKGPVSIPRQQWYVLDAEFVGNMGGAEVVLYNYQAKGGGSGAEGGNDFIVNSLRITRLT
ncbi:hypothetical protein [Pseudomonas sp. MF6747]|uniref:hypothetical protein n=1 Tax=Pseudomonas sp. MF6747 TaxID=2797527 RepID=UPI00190B17C4|nr:hypothetical protein [Pseudomonas sp. MF6747]MBK3508975.1 hypothetical protein [Pseudomonas sp. MF6747]